MNTFVVYDSQYGNTEKVAQAIAKSLYVDATHISNIHVIGKPDILIVGSPTQGGQPTPNVLRLLNSLSPKSLIGTKAAAFDTRFLEADLNLPLKLLVKTIGYAAPKIEKLLVSKGATILKPATGFIVKHTQGPIAAGEIDRASHWLMNLS